MGGFNTPLASETIKKMMFSAFEVMDFKINKDDKNEINSCYDADLLADIFTVFIKNFAGEKRSSEEVIKEIKTMLKSD